MELGEKQRRRALSLQYEKLFLYGTMTVDAVYKLIIKNKCKNQRVKRTT